MKSGIKSRESDRKTVAHHQAHSEGGGELRPDLGSLSTFNRLADDEINKSLEKIKGRELGGGSLK